MEDGVGRVSQIGRESEVLLHRARELRRGQTPAEERVWAMLRGRRLLGLKFRRQHVLHGYIVDFYCHEHRIYIELDGAHHLEDGQKQKDERRDADLGLRGYKVVRLMNDAMFNDPSYLQSLISAACDLPSNFTLHPPL